MAELVRAQHRDQLMLRAGALAYTTLFSFVPLLTVALVMVARVQPENAELVVRAIATVIPFSTDGVQKTLTLFAQRTAALGLVAVVFSILVTFNTFYQIEEVINAIWGIPHRRKWQLRLFSFAMVLLSGPLLITMLFSGLYWMSSRPWYTSISMVARPLPALLAMIALAFLYKWVPHTRVPWKAAVAGAAVGAVALTVVHVGFQTYLLFATDLNVVYGSLSVVLIFLVALFVFWLAILLGAEASWVAGHAVPAKRPEKLAAVLDVLVRIHRHGAVRVTTVARLLDDDADELLGKLAEEPSVVMRTRSRWRLARNADAISLGEVRGRLGWAAPGDAGSDDTLTIAALAKQESQVEGRRQPGNDHAG
jgi:YihY family inner membrane protein